LARETSSIHQIGGNNRANFRERELHFVYVQNTQHAE